MSLFNSNPIEIAGTGLTLDSSFILGTYFNGSIPAATTSKFTVQIFVYKDAASWLADADKNAIKVNELIKNNSFTFTFDRLTDGDIFEFFDIKMKERLLEIFPTWDESLITFYPPHAE